MKTYKNHQLIFALIETLERNLNSNGSQLRAFFCYSRKKPRNLELYNSHFFISFYDFSSLSPRRENFESGSISDEKFQNHAATSVETSMALEKVRQVCSQGVVRGEVSKKISSRNLRTIASLLFDATQEEEFGSLGIG